MSSLLTDAPKEHEQMSVAFLGLGPAELLVAAAVITIALAPILLLVVCNLPPKTPNKGTILAIFLGPLVYIYVGKWGKALGLFFLGWISVIGHLIIWPYSLINIRSDVRRWNEENEIHQARVAAARAQSTPPPSL